MPYCVILYYVTQQYPRLKESTSPNAFINHGERFIIARMALARR
jgi:hypothetical protein